jgi:broad specificity phosphatase PhoE
VKRLLLIRHGQASFGADDYDQLSELGIRQAQALGAAWARLGLRPGSILVGPLRRQRQTWEAARDVARQLGAEWPEPQPVAAWSEHQGMEMSWAAWSAVADRDERVRAWARESQEAQEAQHEQAAERQRALKLRIYRRISSLWAQGELPEAAPFESFQSFRRRIAGALHEARAAAEAGPVAIFTSAGAVAAAIGHVLELGDLPTLELSWVVKNSAQAELRLRRRGFGLLAFNHHFHLTPELETLI